MHRVREPADPELRLLPGLGLQPCGSTDNSSRERRFGCVQNAFTQERGLVCWPLSLSLLNRIHTDPPKQTSKSLFPHLQKKQNMQRVEHTGLEATLANFAVHSLAGCIYIYGERNPPSGLSATNKMCLIQMMVIYFIKSTLRDLSSRSRWEQLPECRKQQLGRQQRVLGHSLASQHRPLTQQAALWVDSLCPWTDGQVRPGCEADSRILSVPACRPHPCRECGTGCVCSVCNQGGGWACMLGLLD